MTVLVFFGLFIFIVLSVFFIGATVVVKQKGTRIMLVFGIVTLLVAAGIAVFSYEIFDELQMKEIMAQEERMKEEAERIEKERAIKKAEQDKRDREEAERKIRERQAAIKNAKNRPPIKPGDMKSAEAAASPADENKRRAKVEQWNTLGKNLADVEEEMYRKVVDIDKQVKQLSADYQAGKITSYDEITARAKLGIQKQDLILDAQDKKQALLVGATLLTDEEKLNDLLLLERRREQAMNERQKFADMLKQAESSKNTLRSM